MFPSVDIVLVEPIYPANIGLTARVMRNFGFSNLVLVNPPPNALRQSMVYAAHASNLIESAQLRSSFAEAVANSWLIVGSTSKVGLSGQNVLRASISPEQLAGNLSKSPQSTCSIVFGRESTGMTNKELNLCDCVLTIPAHPDYRALNMSHSVCIVLYEIFKVIQEETRRSFPVLANKNEKGRILRYFEQIILKVKYQEYRRPIVSRVIRNLLGKAAISRREAYTLLGVLRKVDSALPATEPTRE